MPIFAEINSLEEGSYNHEADSYPKVLNHKDTSGLVPFSNLLYIYLLESLKMSSSNSICIISNAGYLNSL